MCSITCKLPEALQTRGRFYTAGLGLPLHVHALPISAALKNPVLIPSVVTCRAGLSMYHRSLADAALQTPREPWRGRLGAPGAPQHQVVLDTPGARSDSGYDLEDSFLDDSQGAPFPLFSRLEPARTLRSATQQQTRLNVAKCTW